MRIPRLSTTLLGLWLVATSLPAQDAVRHLTQEEAVKSAITKPQPEYPPVAKQLRIQGRIEVEVSIDPAGSVEDVKILTGNPALTGTAVSTLKHWRFEPFLTNGKPAKAVAVMSFSFKL